VQNPEIEHEHVREPDRLKVEFVPWPLERDGTKFANDNSMHRVLRIMKTQRFVKDAGEDTSHFWNGRPFSGFRDALNFCVAQDLKEVELVLVDNEGQEQACVRVM
jgi:hypothetical protein